MPIFVRQIKGALILLTCMSGLLLGCSATPEQETAELEAGTSQEEPSTDASGSSPDTPEIVSSEPEEYDPDSELWGDLVERVVIAPEDGLDNCPCDPVDIVEVEGEEPSMNDWMIAQRNAFSSTVYHFGQSVDSWLGNPEEREVTLDNETYLKVEFSDTVEERGRNYADFGLKLKLDLPYTEHRFKLVFDNNPDDSDSLSEKNIIQESAANQPDQRNESAVGGIRFVFDEYERWKMSTDAGVRLDFPLELFTKFTAKRSGDITENWTGRFKQKFFWYKEDGYGETTEIWFERPITENYFLSLKSQIQWLEDVRFFEFSQSLVTFHRLTETDSMAYRVGAVGQSKPNPRVMTSYINATYRKRLYEDWLFWELTPQVAFPRFYDWDDYWSLTAGIEILFMR